jgi:hypothetical protein
LIDSFQQVPAAGTVRTVQPHASGGQGFLLRGPGAPVAEIGRALGVNATTTQTHLLRIYRNNDTAGRIELMQLSAKTAIP